MGGGPGDDQQRVVVDGRRAAERPDSEESSSGFGGEHMHGRVWGEFLPQLVKCRSECKAVFLCCAWFYR